jgi:glucose-6-phosphate dehydrogenase assembly protein OpcA
MAAVQPQSILRQMAAQWAALAEAGASGKSEAGVMRACSMNLVVAAEDETDAARACQTVAALMYEHPSRAIILKPATRDAALDAQVILQCWMPSGERRQICCERIEITVPEARLDEALRVIPGLLAPDLPAVLWCRGRSWLQHERFRRLHPLLERIVVDSCPLQNASQVFPALAALRQGKARVADLSWTRLTLWRESIANCVSACLLEDSGAVRTVEVRHTGERPSAAALYLAAWLLRGFRNASPAFRSVPGDGQVAGVTIQGGGFHLDLQRLHGDTVRISGCAAMEAVSLPHASEERSMSEELAISGSDVTFEQTLALAAGLAQRMQP